MLIVSNEPEFRRVVRASLAGHFESANAETAEEALVALRLVPFEIVLVDINIDGIEGFELCERVRVIAPQTGVVIMTMRDSEDDCVRALKAGADDFVTKYCRPRELVARLSAVIRRLKNPTPAVLRVGELELDLERWRVFKCGVEIHLTPKEFDLLAYFFRHPGETILHSRLLRAVWGLEYGAEREYLRTFVRSLRLNIEQDAARPQYILTTPYVGYRFCDGVL